MLPFEKAFALIGSALLLFTLSFVYVGPAAAATSAHPTVLEYTDEMNAVVVQLYDTPCVSKPIVAAYPKELIDKAYAATVTVRGKVREACWGAGDGIADIVTDDFEMGSIPMFMFKVVDPI